MPEISEALTIAAIIESCGGCRAIGEDLGLGRQAVFQWNYHGIPIKYWEYVMKNTSLKKKVTPGVLYTLFEQARQAREAKMKMAETIGEDGV